MKKIFILNGSSNSNSITQKVVDDFLNSIKNRFGQISYIKHRISDNTKFCRGCASCFIGKKCLLDNEDEIGTFKEEMLNSDIVVFASPTYFKCVSSQMKLFLDRITYMSHLFSCIGKTGVIIVSGSYNGVDEATQYLKDFMIRLGLINIKIIKYKLLTDSEEYIRNQIKNVSKEIYDYYTGNKKIEISRESEDIFSNTQTYYKMIPDCFEKNYWQKTGLLDAISLENYITINKF